MKTTRRKPASHTPTYGDGGEESPEERVGDAQQEQTDRDAGPEARVDDGLREQVAADALGGLVEGARGGGEPAVAGEPDQPVAQVLALDQHEDHEREDRARAAQHLDQGRELPEAGGLGPHHHRDGRVVRAGRGGRVVLEFAGDVGGGGLHATEYPTSAHLPGVRDLGDQVVAIDRHLGREARELHREDPAHSAEAQDEQADHGGHGDRAAQPPLGQPLHDRMHHEGEEDRQGDRNQDSAGEIERRHARADGEHHGDRLQGRRSATIHHSGARSNRCASGGGASAARASRELEVGRPDRRRSERPRRVVSSR